MFLSGDVTAVRTEAAMKMSYGNAGTCGAGVGGGL